MKTLIKTLLVFLYVDFIYYTCMAAWHMTFDFTAWYGWGKAFVYLIGIGQFLLLLGGVIDNVFSDRKQVDND